MLAVAAYLKGDAAAWFKLTIRKYLKKEVAYSYTLPIKAIFNNYNKFKRKLKEAFSNLDKARD